MAPTQIVQARVSDVTLEQLAADAAVLGLDSTSDAIRAGIELVHRKAEQVRLAESYDDFFGGRPAPMSEVTAGLWGQSE